MQRLQTHLKTKSIFSHPGGMQGGHRFINWTLLFMRSRQISRADEELAHDLTAGEDKRLLE